MIAINCASLSFPEQVAAARTLTRQKSKALRLAVTSGDTAEAEALTWWFLTALEPKLYFADKVARSGKVRPKPTPEDCITLAHTLNLRVAPSEKVRLSLRAKSSGKPRFILNFGWEHRTAQQVLRLILSAYHRPQPFQFTHQGPKRAVLRTCELIEAGNLWFAHLDIKEFYPSFLIEKLREDAALAGILPGKTLAGFVIGRNLEVHVRADTLIRFPHLSYTSLLWEARRGIPTGSCASSVLAPMMVSRLPLDAALKALLINYEDDFLLLAPTKVALQKAVEAFMAAVKYLPGGRFRIKVKSTGHLPSDQISCLGHLISLEDGQLRVGFNASNQEGFYSFLQDFDGRKGEFALKKGSSEGEQRLAHCLRAWAYLRSWLAAFALCGPAATETVEVGLIAIEAELAKLGKSLEFLSAAKGTGGFTPSEHFEFSGMS